MASDERKFRIRPPRRRTGRSDEVRIWSMAFKRLSHIVRMSSRRIRSAARRPRRPQGQRCAVRVSYSGNRVSGQWRAHGRYLAREGATQTGAQKSAFGRLDADMDMPRTLNGWQQSGDERMFKLIISPEFGDRMDLVTHTRALMSQIEQDLGTILEWTAVCHYNTSHPHVHIALRGRDERGHPLRLERDYIRVVIRQHAENLCTAQLGYRTQLDILDAQRKEVDQHRYTSLDRLITRAASGESNPDFLKVNLAPPIAAPDDFRKLQFQNTANRLFFLEKLGLAARAGPASWIIRHNFGEALRAMQQLSDRQKTLAAHGVIVSDPRLPLRFTASTAIRELEGRVLGHGQEDSTGRPYTLIEGMDENIHFIYQDESIESARRHGRMRANSYVRLRRAPANRRGGLLVDDLGDAEALLDDRRFITAAAQRLLKRRPHFDEVPRWSGWLGRYHTKLQLEAKLWRHPPTPNRPSRPSLPLARE